MINSINQVDAAVVKPTVNQEKSVTESTIKSETKTKTETQSVVNRSPDGDTVEISSEGKSALQQLSDDSSKAADSTVDTQNLSQYTDFELKQMYMKGNISQLEYSQEIESRDLSHS